MYKYRLINTFLICILFTLIMLSSNKHGKSSVTFASTPSINSINEPESAYNIWKTNKVTGRTLILFDGYPHNMGYYSYNGEPRLLPTNLIEYSIFQNIIRRIYLVVPEIEWSEFRNQKFIRPIREASDLVKGLYLYNQSGIPIIAVTPASIPQLKEQPLVYINNKRFSNEEALALLVRNNIHSDIIISCASKP